jgi:biopolymer transport protein TolQ
MSLWAFVSEASLFSKLLLLLLLLISLFSWAVIFERILFFRRVSASANAFAMLAIKCQDLSELISLANQHSQALAANTISNAAATQGLATQSAISWERLLLHEGSMAQQSAERFLSYLATISSTSPFIGLLGTVWGVMVAFLQIGSSAGQAMLEVVGPGIAEALIATVAGLATAIPASVAYNMFNAAANRQRQSIEAAATQAILLVERNS